MRRYSRRELFRTALAGTAAAWAALRWPSPAVGAESQGTSALVAASKSRVALISGQDRAEMTFKALKVFEKEITQAIGNKRVIVKPNNVFAGSRLACTDPANLEGILEFLKSIDKCSDVLIAESGAVVPTLEGFEGLGYNPVAARYNAKLVDLDRDAYELMPCLNEQDMQAHPCRVSKLLMDPNNFVISAAKLKTHDTVVATLSLKNIVMAAPLKINRGSDKRIVHGGGYRAINLNIASLGTRLQPDLAVIDGFEGMEGDGPVRGTAVDHKVCVVGLDWLAADRVGLELMGIDPKQVGYLVYCARLGMGEYDLDRIEVVGEKVQDHVRKYRLANNIEQQLQWMKQST